MEQGQEDLELSLNDVRATLDTEGSILPESILWADGTEYEIDRVLDIRKAASMVAGGFDVRYTVRIQGKQRHLFLEENRWFVEGRG